MLGLALFLMPLVLLSVFIALGIISTLILRLYKRCRNSSQTPILSKGIWISCFLLVGSWLFIFYAIHITFQLPFDDSVNADRSEVVGRWVLTDETKLFILSYKPWDKNKTLPDYGVTKKSLDGSFIEFKKNGECMYNSVRFKSCDPDYFVGKGRWEIQESKIIFKMEGKEFYINESIGIGRDNDQLILWNFICDPDSMDFIKFKKIP